MKSIQYPLPYPLSLWQAESGKTAYAIAILASFALVLAGCGGGDSLLGYSKNAPDEFSVTTYNPLVLPPDYNLRPPKTKTENGGNGTGAGTDESETGATNNEVPIVRPTSKAPASKGELALLKQVKASTLTPTPEPAP
ncbi:MAG: DUF3035 domain-containing protein [Parvularculales bacterium]